MMSRRFRSLLATVAIPLLVTAPILGSSPARAASESGSSEFFDGFASWLLSIPYGAFKLGFGIFGGLAGGATYGFAGADADAGAKVWDPSLGGSWIIEPDIIRGREKLQFVGVPPIEKGAYWSGPLAFFATLPYGGIKTGVGLLGGIFGTFAWIGSGGNGDVAAKVWDPTVRGDYVIGKDVIRGERPPEFIGKP